MSFARDPYTATSGQTDFVISFPYLDEAHVLVYQNGTLLTQGTDYTIPSAALMRLVSGATTGDIIVIRRATSQTVRLVDYEPGTLSEDDLDTDSLQAFYLAQEAADFGLHIEDNQVFDAVGLRVTEVAAPTAEADAATKEYVDEAITGSGDVPVTTEANDGYLLTSHEATWTWDALEVTGAQIEDAAVNTEHFTAGAVDGTALADLAVDTEHLAVGAVDNAAIADGQVDTEHFALGAVDNAAIADGQVDTEHFAAAAVDAAAIEDLAVDTEHLAAAAVSLAKLDAAAGTEGQVLTNEEATSVVWATPSGGGSWTYGTLSTATGGTEFSFTGLPTGITELEFLILNLSASGTDEMFCQIGPVAGPVGTGYTGRVNNVANVGVNWSSSAQIGVAQTAAQRYSGKVTLSLANAASNLWLIQSVIVETNDVDVFVGSGYLALAGALENIRLVLSGSDTFDSNAGIQIRYR